MNRASLVVACVFAGLVLVSSSAASVTAYTGYAGPRFWLAGESGGSTYSSSWTRNAFNKERSGYDTTVTFIDNVGYGWHATIRNTSLVTYTFWWTSQVKKAHCKAHVGGFNGGCWVHTS